MQLSARELAAIVNGDIEGDPDVMVDRPSKIEEGGPGSISFLGNMRYESYAYTTGASVLIVDRDFQPRQPVAATLLRVAEVYPAVAKLFEHFQRLQSSVEQGVRSAHAMIDPAAELHPSVSVGPGAVVEAGARIGEGTRLDGQCYIGRDVEIGRDCRIYPGARVLQGCRMGDRCVVQANTVIGADGFGYSPQEDGSYRKIQQLGIVVLEDDVEIGANSTIDRATMGETRIRQGVKLDNLIQIGHNVEIGAHTVIAAQTGVAGSTRIGRHCRIGGQVGFVGHIQVADHTQIQAQSGLASNVTEPGQALFGSPAIAYRDYVRAYVLFRQLPELEKRLRELEKR